MNDQLSRVVVGASVLRSRQVCQSAKALHAFIRKSANVRTTRFLSQYRTRSPVNSRSTNFTSFHFLSPFPRVSLTLLFPRSEPRKLVRHVHFLEETFPNFRDLKYFGNLSQSRTSPRNFLVLGFEALFTERVSTGETFLLPRRRQKSRDFSIDCLFLVSQNWTFVKCSWFLIVICRILRFFFSLYCIFVSFFLIITYTIKKKE